MKAHHNVESLQKSREEAFVFLWNCEGQSGIRTSDLRLSKQTPLTNALHEERNAVIT